MDPGRDLRAGTPGHSWQATSCTGGSIGRKGMMVAAKTLALTAMDLLTDPGKVAAARASFEKRGVDGSTSRGFPRALRLLYHPELN